MLQISTGLISNTLLSLHAIDRYKIKSQHTLFELGHLTISQEYLIEFCIACKWINDDSNAGLMITETGKQILLEYREYGYSSTVVRKILFDYIINCKPMWGYRIPLGRKEAYFIMTKEEQRCFAEANLMDENITPDCIRWWDEVANGFRSDADQRKNEIGRNGEFLTLLYEKNRTTSIPIYQSIDSNLSGFDIISVVSSENDQKLLIEVKSTNKSISSASFFVSDNEWNVATTSESYMFYLWILDSTPKLAKLSPDDVKSHIPVIQGDGKWTSVEIPFKSFLGYFEEVNPCLLQD
jgi:hypothetical protein